MPVFYSQTIDDYTRLAVWEITEPETFFTNRVPASRLVTHPQKRLQHLAGRFLLAWLFPDFPFSLIQVAFSRKPFIPGDSHHFNISHSGQYAAAIVSQTQRVGIDIELMTPRILRVQPKFCSPAEQGVLHSQAKTLPDMHQATLLWSAKEAVYKWQGLGGLDFTTDMKMQSLVFDTPQSGQITLLLTQPCPQLLTISFVIFQHLVLCWLAHPGIFETAIPKATVEGTARDDR